MEALGVLLCLQKWEPADITFSVPGKEKGMFADYCLNEKGIGGMWYRNWVLSEPPWKAMPVKIPDAAAQN